MGRRSMEGTEVVRVRMDGDGSFGPTSPGFSPARLVGPRSDRGGEEHPRRITRIDGLSATFPLLGLGLGSISCSQSVGLEHGIFGVGLGEGGIFPTLGLGRGVGPWVRILHGGGRVSRGPHHGRRRRATCGDQTAKTHPRGTTPKPIRSGCTTTQAREAKERGTCT